MIKTTKLHEDIENMTDRINKNLDKPASKQTVVPPVYGEAEENEKKVKGAVGKVFKDLKKSADGITPDAQGTGKKVKTNYTEKFTLDESLFEDSSVSPNTVADFIRKSVKQLVKDDMGCSTYRLDNRLAICVGWLDGYDADDTEAIHSKSQPTWCINAGLKVWTSDSMRTDYDFINSPYYENGGVVDTDTTIAPDEDYAGVARYLLGEYDGISDFDIDKDGKILDSEDIDESCKKVTEATVLDMPVRRKKPRMIEELPDTVYELVYDRLFPVSLHNYTTTIVPGEDGYDSRDYFSKGLGEWDIGVAVRDEEGASLVKRVADFLGLKYSYKPSRLLRGGLGGIAVIYMDDETANTPTDEYLDNLGHGSRGHVKKYDTSRKVAESVEIHPDTISLDEFEPWSGAIPWYAIIKDQGKLEEFDRYLEELYPEGINETELNDLIWFEPETVFEWIGINYDFQNDKLIDDEDDESDDGDNE